MDRRKELKAQYRARKVTGGIYRIVNRNNGRFYLQSTDDIQATRNWFESVHIFGDCPLPPLREDWGKNGIDSFSLEELDLLEKKETQTSEEFRSDLKALLDMWSEQLPKDSRY